MHIDGPCQDTPQGRSLETVLPPFVPPEHGRELPPSPAVSGQDIDVPAGLALEARYADISDQLERKNAGLRMYAGEVQRLFDDEQGMLDAVTGYAARVAAAGGVGTGAAERYWSVVRS